MHELTIAAATGANTTTHRDYAAASHALLVHAKRSDTYLRTVAHPTAQRAVFDLLRLSSTSTRPDVIGAAFIEPVAVTAAGRCITPYCAAAAALQWISDQTAVRRPAHAALDAAQAARQSTLQARALWDEAAALVDLPATPPATATFDTLRHAVVARRFRPDSPAALATAVQRHADAAVTTEQVAVLIWWTALLSWATSGQL